MSPARTRFAILGVLTAGARTGYEIRHLLTEETGHCWQESYGQLYPTLRTLEAEGLVRARTEAGAKAQERRRYALTNAGLAAFRAWLAEPSTEAPPRDEAQFRLWFGAQLPREAVAGQVAAIEARAAARLAALATRERQLTETPGRHQLFRLLTIRHAMAQARATLAWANEARTALRTGEPPAPLDEQLELV